MDIRYSEEVKKLINRMNSISQKEDMEEITSVTLLYALMEVQKFARALSRATKYSYEDFQREVIESLDTWYEDDVQEIQGERLENLYKKVNGNGKIDNDTAIVMNDLLDILEYAEFIAEDEERMEVTIDDVVDSFLQNMSKSISIIFSETSTDIDVLLEEYENPDMSEDVFFLPGNLSSFVEVLNNKFIKNPNCAILGRDSECEEIWKTMMKKTKRNAILVGEPGVGKSSIVYKLTCDIINGKCPEEFKDFAILSLNVNSLVAGTMFRGQAEERYQSIIEFIQENKNVILFIDEIHMIIGAGSCSQEDNQDFSNALKPLLAGDDARVIGATTHEEYERCFEGEGALRRRFRTIEVKEPKMHEVYPMLKDSIKQLSEFHGVAISKKMVDFIILNSACFNYQTCNPDRTKDLIDLSMATARKFGKKAVNKASVMKNFAVNMKQFHNMKLSLVKSTAYHEMGHYIMWRLSGKLVDKEVIAVSILPAEDYLGVNVLDQTDDMAEHNMDYYIDEIATLLAGRVAEKVFTKSNSSGAAADLEHATKIAYKIVAESGMSLKTDNNRIYLNQGEYHMQSDETINNINKQIDEIIKKAYTRAERVITSNPRLLEQLADIISQRGIMGKNELDMIVTNYFQESQMAATK